MKKVKGCGPWNSKHAWVQKSGAYECTVCNAYVSERSWTAFKDVCAVLGPGVLKAAMAATGMKVDVKRTRAEARVAQLEAEVSDVSFMSVEGRAEARIAQLEAEVKDLRASVEDLGLRLDSTCRCEMTCDECTKCDGEDCACDFSGSGGDQEGT